MGLFKDDDISEIEGLDLDAGALEGFGDDSIDKDLLNQIFADDGGSPDDETEDAQLDVDSEGFYIDEDTSSSSGEDIIIEEAAEPAASVDESSVRPCLRRTLYDQASRCRAWIQKL